MHRLCRSAAAVVMTLTVPPGVGLAQSPDPSALPSQALLEEWAARRFPQPVRVGDLAGRKLLGPIVSQPVLGRVAAIVRGTDGRTKVVVRLARWFWERDRLAAVPVEAVALLGEHVVLLDLTAEQLKGLPAFDPATASEVGRDERIRIGLTKPFH